MSLKNLLLKLYKMLLKLSTFDAPSQVQLQWETLGPKPIDLEVIDVLEFAWREGFSIQSDYSRYRSRAVSEAASRGWITTEDQGNYGRMWRISMEGHEVLEKSYEES